MLQSNYVSTGNLGGEYMEPVSVVWIVTLSLILATLVEGGIEYIFGTVFDKVPVLKDYRWLLMYVGLLAGVALSFYYAIDLIALAANLAGATQTTTPVGVVLTGLVIGRGANYLHDFVSRWLIKEND